VPSRAPQLQPLPAEVGRGLFASLRNAGREGRRVCSRVCPRPSESLSKVARSRATSASLPAERARGSVCPATFGRLIAEPGQCHQRFFSFCCTCCIKPVARNPATNGGLRMAFVTLGLGARAAAAMAQALRLVMHADARRCTLIQADARRCSHQIGVTKAMRRPPSPVVAGLLQELLQQA
jgi:hypothetical protein